MTTGSLATTQQQRPPFYRDAVVLKWAVQLAVLAAVIAAFWFSASVGLQSLDDKGIDADFDYITESVGIQIAEGIDTKPNNGGRALWVGMVNTLRMSAAGLILATMLGVLIGVSRLSSNWMVSKLASTFIETVRNIPLLVQIIIIFTVFTVILPGFRDFEDPFNEVGPINGWLHITNKGVAMPRPHIADGFYQWAIWLLIGAIIARFVYKNRANARDEHGGETYPGWIALGVIAIFAVIGWLAHTVFSFLGAPIQTLSDLIGRVPQAAVQIALTVVAFAAAARWIQNFFAQRRTPGGSARLTDDDWFRVIFAGLGAVLAAGVLWVLWPGLSSWIVNSTSDLFRVIGDKFSAERTGAPLGFQRPDIVQPGNFANNGVQGLVLTTWFTALFFGVVMYTSAFIAEIVRGGILAVPKGQSEAAAAMGLSRMQSLRKVILPQALRVSLPPLGNQYLNLVKNTSLGVAIGYADLVTVGSTIGNQKGQFLTVFPVIMAFYLTCSLSISAVVNYFNRRLAIVER